jgi:hypothetical protein
MRWSLITLVGILIVLRAASWARSQDGEKRPPAPAAQAAPTPAVKPKPIAESTRRGLEWLVKQQLGQGAWGQGEEAAGMGGGKPLRDTPNVADTCMAALALLRSGSTPAQGPHARPLAAAVGFVCGKIEASDADSISVTDVQGTRTQAKLGTTIDTFLANLLLAEARGKMPDEAANRRLQAAHDKVLRKIGKNQKQDGSWDGSGWAPILCQSMASKGLNRAAQTGVTVAPEVLARVEKNAQQNFDGMSFAAAGSAGVALYATAGNFSALREAEVTNRKSEAQLRGRLVAAKDEKERSGIQQSLDRIEESKKLQAQAEQTVLRQIDDPQFVAGFGSNGGEEFLSYMNISESLLVKGGREWQEWDASMAANLGRIQNQDGSWTGHHCITGRTFCTSAALLVLLADRTPIPPQPATTTAPAPAPEGK